MPQPSVKSIWLELQIDPSDPELLATLDRMGRSGMLDRSQILQIASSCLSADISWKALPAAILTLDPSASQAPTPIKIPSPVQTIWQNLKDDGLGILLLRGLYWVANDRRGSSWRISRSALWTAAR